MNPEYIALIDENGEEVEFELLDVLEYQGNKYYCMTFVSDENQDEDELEEEPVLIMSSVLNEKGEDVVETVTDDTLIEKLFELFKERNSELFEFIDDEEE